MPGGDTLPRSAVSHRHRRHRLRPDGLRDEPRDDADPGDLYRGECQPLFTELPIDSRRPSLDVLFITDRARAKQPDNPPYTTERSRSMAFGSAIIEFGEDVSWDALVKESTAPQRANPLQLKLGPTTELGRFPAIPYEVVVGSDGIRRVPAVVEAYEKAKQQLQAEIARRLAIARRKEVVLFVHGYNASFESAALTMGELCHFLGRDFVCGMFSWPAGGREACSSATTSTGNRPNTRWRTC